MVIEVKNVFELIRSGRVRRWHTDTDMNGVVENNADHQWQVAMLLIYLNPDVTRGTLIHALTHDVGELRTGDMSYTVKRNNPDLAASVAEHESVEKRKIIENLTVCDSNLVKLCDWASAWLTMMRHRPNLRDRADWLRQRHEMRGLAERSGYIEKFDEFLLGVELATNAGYLV